MAVQSPQEKLFPVQIETVRLEFGSSEAESLCFFIRFPVREHGFAGIYVRVIDIPQLRVFDRDIKAPLFSGVHADRLTFRRNYPYLQTAPRF